MWKFILVVASAATLDAGVVLTPPRLEREPRRSVWYTVPTQGEITKFVLPCEASGDPEEYIWMKNGKQLEIDGVSIEYQRPGQSGTIAFNQPTADDQGYYQCFVKNIFGTAVSNRVHVQRGVLDHFRRVDDVIEIHVDQMASLNLSCEKPAGDPEPSLFWLYRNARKPEVIETINQKHITTDGDGNLQFSIVQGHDGREDLLYQCCAQSAALLGEHRAGPFFRLVVGKNKADGWSTSKLLWASPEQVTFVAGTTLRLMCIFGGYPVATPTWSRTDGQPLAKDRMLTDFEHLEFGKSLNIKKVRPSDAGEYECRHGHISHKMTVTVTASPYWVDGPPMDITRAEDSTAELHCDVEGDPTPLVRWFMNGQPLDTVMNDNDVTVRGNHLVITHLDHDRHRAVYQCNASNPLGYVFTNAYINVEAYPPSFLHPTNQTIRVTRGETVYLDCAWKGAPTPLVKRIDENDRDIIANPPKLFIYPNDTIRISDAQMADAGLYYCNCSNRYGFARARTEVIVYEPTLMSEVLPTSPKTIEAHQSINLSCAATTDPRLTPEYKWLFDGKPLDIGIDDTHYKLANPNQLQILNARGRHSGEYECRIETLVDEKNSKLKLYVTDIPDAPMITNLSCEDRKVLIGWKAAKANNDPVTKYLVQKATSFKPKEWRLELTDTPESYEAGNTLFTAEIALSPWVNYTFRVIAVNGHGASAPGYSVQTCITKAALPYTNPLNVTASGSAPDNLVVSWIPMDKEDWNGENFRYYVRYRLDEPGTNWTQFDVEDPLLDHTTIREQPTYRKYEVMVGARNVIGKSLIDPTLITGYSGEDVPSVAPLHFRRVKVEGLNATSVRFAWDPVQNHTINGNFIGYKVVVRPMPQSKKDQILNSFRGQPAQIVSKTVNLQTTELTLISLRPLQSYSATVAAMNTQFTGPTSNQVLFTQPEGIPSEVTELKVYRLGATTLRLTWQEPLFPLGKLRGYYLEFENLDKPNEGAYETFQGYFDLDYEFEEADPDSQYRITVWAETGGGQGPNVSVLANTWPAIPPGQPNIATDLDTPTSLTLTWLPSEDSMPGTFAYFNYSIKGSNVWTQTPKIKVPTFSSRIEGLVPGMTYWIEAVAQDGNWSTPSALYRVEMPPSVYANTGNDYMTSAAWFIAILCAVAVALVSLVVVCIRQNRGEKYSVKKKEIERGAIGFNDNDEERTFMEYQFGDNNYKDNT